MDPVTVFGLAAAVLQFVQFSNGLLKSSVKIYATSRPSSSGDDAACVALDAICERLHNLSSDLSIPAQDSSSSLSRNEKVLRDLAIACQKDCEDLVDKLKDVRAKSRRKRFWNSFQEALRDSFQGRPDSFRQFQDRLKAYESSMSLHMSAVVIESGKSLHNDLVRFREDQKTSAAYQLRALREIESKITQKLDDWAGHTTTSLPPGRTGGEAFQMDMEQLVIQLKDLSVKSLDAQQMHQILASLEYDQRPVRHDGIADAHANTFAWALKHLSTQDSTQVAERKAGQGDLLGWLKSGSGFFWVSGKPGSGKSTFMKFLADHPSTKSTLASWAGSRPLVIASHYFWISGTEIQRSERGMLQSLLLDIFQQAPRTVSKVCQGRSGYSQSWSIVQLRECLQEVAKQSELRVCIFIDGLDEFGGEHADHLDMAMFLKELSDSSNLKLCVSSRPWNAFEQTFGQSTASKLYMQELTRVDVLEFTRSRLTKHPRWINTVPHDHGEELVEGIVTRARGVFLWVSLVIKLLRQDLTDGATIHQLQKTLDSLPPELEPFYKHMLDSVDSRHHERMSGILQLALRANPELEHDFKIFYFHEMEYEDEDYALKLHPKQVDSNWDERVRSRTIERFDALCKGLLEFHWFDDDVGACLFTHRTVKDWLLTESTQQYLRQKSRPGFDPTLSLLRAVLAWFKHPSGPRQVYRPFDSLTWEAVPMDISRLKDQKSPLTSQIHVVLDNFVAAAATLADIGMIESEPLSLPGHDLYDETHVFFGPSLSYLRMIQYKFIEWSLWDYLYDKVENDSGYFTTFLIQHEYGPRKAFWADVRSKTTSDREAGVRSKLTIHLLSSLLRRFIPPVPRPTHGCHRQGITPVRNSDEVENAAYFMRCLFFKLGAGSDEIARPTVTSTRAEVQAWAGLLLWPLSENFHSALVYKMFKLDVLPKLLCENDSNLMLLHHDPGLTVWDVICELVTTLLSRGRFQDHKAYNCQEDFVRLLIQKFSNTGQELPWKNLRFAVMQGFLASSSVRLTEEMVKRGLIPQGIVLPSSGQLQRRRADGHPTADEPARKRRHISMSNPLCS